MSDVFWYVSLADVVKHPKYDCGGSLDEILYDFGMDTKRGYFDDERHLKNCSYKVDVDEFGYSHRTLSGEVVTCARYVGRARQDGKWRSWVSHYLNLPVEFGSRR